MQGKKISIQIDKYEIVLLLAYIWAYLSSQIWRLRAIFYFLFSFCPVLPSFPLWKPFETCSGFKSTFEAGNLSWLTISWTVLYEKKLFRYKICVNRRIRGFHQASSSVRTINQIIFCCATKRLMHSEGLGLDRRGPSLLLNMMKFNFLRDKFKKC